jgi:hypothetical protein
VSFDLRDIRVSVRSAEASKERSADRITCYVGKFLPFGDRLGGGLRSPSPEKPQNKMYTVALEQQGFDGYLFVGFYFSVMIPVFIFGGNICGF